jgi:hypothetical protein
VRLPRLLSLFVLALAIATIGGTNRARAEQTVRPSDAASPAELRQVADHYRRVTWTYQRAAKTRRTASSLSYRRSPDRRYLRWTIALWQGRAEQARARALDVVEHRVRLRVPSEPQSHAALVSRIVYHRALTWRLQKVYPGRTTAGSNVFRTTRSDAYRRWALRLWERRAAAAALAVSRHAKPKPEPKAAKAKPRRLLAANPLASGFLCIHNFEGPWTANTGNGYYGGLQMDWGFMRSYGGDFLARWGTADNWPVWAQIEAASRAHRSGRGFTPWPNTARACGLI